MQPVLGTEFFLSLGCRSSETLWLESSVFKTLLPSFYWSESDCLVWNRKALCKSVFHFFFFFFLIKIPPKLTACCYLDWHVARLSLPGWTTSPCWRAWSCWKSFARSWQPLHLWSTTLPPPREEPLPGGEANRTAVHISSEKAPSHLLKRGSRPFSMKYCCKLDRSISNPSSGQLQYSVVW